MTKIFTIDELTNLCCFWQERLGLSHWHIAVQINRSDDLPLSGSQAANKISLDTEQALISLIDPRDFPLSPFEQDMEVSLVHELLHIPLKFFANPENETLQHTHMEAFIERTARLLVCLARKEKENK